MSLSDFEKDLAIEVAAQDSDLRALFELETFGVTHAVSDKRAEAIETMDEDQTLQLRSEIKRTYGLGETDFKRALTRCIADVAGVNSGRTSLPSHG
jgi:hypothetical protein